MTNHSLDFFAKQAYKGFNLMDAGCAGILQLINNIVELEYTDDMHVFIQDGDGLVLCWNNFNIPVSLIFSTHRELKRKLSDIDLEELAI